MIVMRLWTTISFLLILCFSCLTAQSQDNYLTVNTITINGLNKTKESIVLRELDFVVGDTLWLSDMPIRLELNKNRILSTALFNLAEVNVVNWDTDLRQADITFDLVEAWYIYPSPIFELADRNFNVWWNEQGRSLDRVNYGMRLDHINLTGHKDYLKLKFQRGYTPKYEIKYIYPYLDKEQRWGMEASIFYSTNKEISYVTLNNKPTFISAVDDRIILKRFRVGGGLTRRVGLFAYHSLKLEYHHNQVDQLIADNNPDYFLQGDTDLKFLLLDYQFKIDQREFSIYPHGGYLLELQAKQEGFGLLGTFDNTLISGKLALYHRWQDRWIISNTFKGKYNINRDQIAFANNTGLGYGEDYIRGYELYVQDGTDYVYNLSYVSFKFVDKVLNYGRLMPLDQFKLMALQVHLRMQVHLGYVHEPSYQLTNEQNNRLLIGYGPALDILIYNNFLFQLEYTFNHLNESQLYIHQTISF